MEKDNILLSIIIPIYNLEEYITKCLDSVIMQEPKNVEIILIDDGSTDKSSIICKGYCEKHKYIKYFYQENSGVSSARNLGIHQASGLYIQFLDGDDTLFSGSIDEILTKIKENKYDIIAGNYVKSFGNELEKKRNINRKLINLIENSSYPDNIVLMLKNNLFAYSSCFNIIKKVIIDKYSILFDTDVKFTEDMTFCLKVLLNAKTIAIIQPHYIYIQDRIQSATSSISLKRISDNFNFVLYWHEYMKNYNCNKNIKKYIDGFISYEYCIVYGMLFLLDTGDFNLLYDDVKKYSFLLNGVSNKKVIIVKILKKIIGFNMTGKILAKFIASK